MTRLHLILAAATLILLGLLVRELHRSRAPSGEVRARSLPTPAPRRSPPVPTSLPPPTPVGPEARHEPPVEPAPLAAARQQTEAILRSGVLTPDDVLRLRAQLDQLPRAEAFELRRRLAHAINTSEIVPSEIPFTLP